MQKIVCVFAHPDDEAMGPGGTIAKLAKESEVYLLCATAGNGQENQDPGQMGEIRKQELLDSAEILGIRKVDFLGFDDGQLSHNTYHKLVEEIAEKVEQYQPDTLLTFEQSGLTGHLDHIAVSLATSYVFKKQSGVRKLLYFCYSKELAARLAENYFIFVPPGYSQDRVDQVVDISSEIEQKIKAIDAHKSQTTDGERYKKLLAETNQTQEYFLKLEKL